MRDVANRPLLLSPRSAAGLTYSELCRELGEPQVRLRPWCRPTSLADAWREITRALIFGAEVTLFDADWTESEIHALGFAEEQLGTARAVAGLPGLTPELLAAAVSASSAARINLFTSGSTGRPRLVRHSLASLVRGVRASAAHHDDTWAFAYNPTHIAGVQVFLQALANLNTLVDVTGLDRLMIYDVFRRHRVTHVSATPTFYRLLLPCLEPLPGVCRVVLGGEASAADLRAELGRIFPAASLRNIYASTEAGSLLACDGEVFAVPPHLADVIVVREGRLLLHRRLMAEFDGPWIDGEWYDSGDRVELTGERPLRFRLVGREADCVNVGGHKVDPLEVERRLEAHPGVVAARVFGRNNSVSGQILCAEVVSRGISIAEVDLRAYLGAHLQAAKIPRLIRFVSEIKATRSGKRLRA